MPLDIFRNQYRTRRLRLSTFTTMSRMCKRYLALFHLPKVHSAMKNVDQKISKLNQPISQSTGEKKKEKDSDEWQFTTNVRTT